WRKLAPLIAIAAAPILVRLPAWLIGVALNPLWVSASLTGSATPPLAPGLPGFMDIETGWTTQALGTQAARLWLSGQVPWWDHFSGIGLPLAAEMQSSALFLPYILLLALPAGALLLMMAMQVTGGLAAFALMRRLGLGAFASTTGALLFELGGSFAWLGMPCILVLAFLPLFLLGLERARAVAGTGRWSGYRTIALAIALSLYAGFPETAYLDGLMALAWAAYRFATLPAGARGGFALRVAFGGLAGLALAAPVLLPFVHLLGHASLGARADMDMGLIALPDPGNALYMLPYFLGPIAGFSGFEPTGTLSALWGRVGGYLGFPLAVAAVLGLFASGRRERGLRILLGVWILACFVRSAAVPGLRHIWDVVPFMSQIQFFRYAGPTWMLAACLLAAFALDGRRDRARALLWSCCAVLVFASATYLTVRAGQPMVQTLLAAAPGYRRFLIFSLVWGGATALLSIVAWQFVRRSVLPAAVLLLDAALLFAIPQFSGPRRPVLDADGIGFLQNHLGLERFYTLGPFQPNYGGMFGVASINHNYLPLPHWWPDFVRATLDPRADPVLFMGGFPPDVPGQPSHADALRANLPAFADLGVRYVLTFAGTPALEGLTRVHQTPLMAIYEIPGAAPYIDAGACEVVASGRDAATATCKQPATLTRRELWFPGWRVSVNGQAQEVQRSGPLFQGVDLPPGRSEIVFTYRPPGFAVCAALFAAGAAAVLLPFVRPRRRTPAPALVHAG
ncbi:MAG TPA: YfhO family protein, partial [Acetobacteraceae bacterium]|nr:YfhO family protein [Acetobacteraceae bacterium]